MSVASQRWKAAKATRRWGVSVFCALGGHGALLLAVVAGGDPGSPREERVQGWKGFGPPPTLADLRRARGATVVLLSVTETRPLPVPLFPPAVEDENQAVSPRHSAQGAPSPDRAPAPDRRTEDQAGMRNQQIHRRDRNTLRGQLSDGARHYALPRSHTGAQSQSPQAERQESRVGVGDSIRGARETREWSDAQGPGTAWPPENADESPDGVQVAGTSATGEGPPQAEKGPRRFDVEQRGRAVDNAAVRSASDQQEPGIIEYAEAGTPGVAQGHRGPGSEDGASAKTGPGRNPVTPGSRTGIPTADEAKKRTQAAHRQRLERNIQAKATAAMVFPRQMALLMHQGETIVRFVVATDGRLAGPVVVVKSAGFRQFDEEAVAAVRRAAPFTQMPEALSVRMRMRFDNPAVR